MDGALVSSPLFQPCRGEAFGMRIMPGRPHEKLCGGGVGMRISASAWELDGFRMVQIGMGPIE